MHCLLFRVMRAPACSCVSTPLHGASLEPEASIVTTLLLGLLSSCWQEGCLSVQPLTPTYMRGMHWL